MVAETTKSDSNQSCRPLIASAPTCAPAPSASDERRSVFSPLNLAAPPPTVSVIYISTQQLFLLPGDRFSFCSPDIRWHWPLGGGAVQWVKKPAHRYRLSLSLQLERRYERRYQQYLRKISWLLYDFLVSATIILFSQETISATNVYYKLHNQFLATD